MKHLHLDFDFDFSMSLYLSNYNYCMAYCNVDPTNIKSLVRSSGCRFRRQIVLSKE